MDLSKELDSIRKFMVTSLDEDNDCYDLIIIRILKISNTFTEFTNNCKSVFKYSAINENDLKTYFRIYIAGIERVSEGVEKRKLESR